MHIHQGSSTPFCGTAQSKKPLVRTVALAKICEHASSYLASNPVSIADTHRPATHDANQVAVWCETSSALVPRRILCNANCCSSYVFFAIFQTVIWFTKRCSSNSCTTVLCHRSIQETQQTTTCRRTYKFDPCRRKSRRLLAAVQDQGPSHRPCLVPSLHPVIYVSVEHYPACPGPPSH